MAASDDRRLPDEQTLFHLIPLNEQAEAAVDDGDNSRCVSISTTCGRRGLEVGFHVPPHSRGDVITRLGRDADLTLNHPIISSRHVDFHLNMHTHMVMLRVLSKDEASVSVVLCSSEDAGVDDVDMGGVDAPERDECRDNFGDCVLLYGRTYQINICDYKFNLIWVRKSPEELKAIALKGQKVSDAKAKELPQRKQPTPTDLVSCLRSRPPDSPECRIRETADSRELKHESHFTTVHKALEHSYGNNIIVVTVKLSKFGVQRKDEVRAAIHREVTFLKKHRHEHIIPCLGSKNFETDWPVFYNDLADGDISRLPEIQKTLWEGALGERMLLQILDALAFLAKNHMCHGSIEPAKILYHYDNGETQNETEVDKYDFQLSHFGISKYDAKPPAQFRARSSGTTINQTRQRW